MSLRLLSTNHESPGFSRGERQLTRNGQGVYSIRDIKDEENFQKAEAVIRLMGELNAGIRSAEEEGWIAKEELRNHLKNKKNAQR